MKTHARASLFWIAYTHVVGVLGALSIAGFLPNVVHIDWHALVSALIGFWADAIRPLAHYTLYWTVGLLLRTLGIDIQFPAIVRDYVAVGLVLLFSYVRAFASLHNFNVGVVVTDIRTFWKFWLLELVGVLVAWPVMLLLIVYRFIFPLGFARAMLAQTIDSEKRAAARPQVVRYFARLIFRPAPGNAEGSDEIEEWVVLARRWAVLSLSPLFYLGVLFAANYLLRVWEM